MTLREQLIRDEGLRLKPYTDSTGHLTIGYGFNLSNGIPLPIAEALLDYKMREAIDDVTKHLPWTATLDDIRFAVLANMTYNIGIGGLLGFRRMLIALEVFDYERAANEMEDSLWYTQVGPRAHRLIQQMRTGLWV